MNGVHWRAAPPTLSSLLGLAFKGEREGGNIGSFSVLYRISLFSIPFADVSPFFSKKFCIRALRNHLYAPFIFPFPLIALLKKPPPARNQ
jgi:hypothetical protein